jgi:hypothetical protein
VKQRPRRRRGAPDLESRRLAAVQRYPLVAAVPVTVDRQPFFSRSREDREQQQTRECHPESPADLPCGMLHALFESSI